MASCNFVFDIVVTHFEALKCKIDDIKKLQVEFIFNGIRIPLSSDCINVSDFNSECSTEFMVTPKELRNSLEKCGMPVSVQYNNKLLGTAVFVFSQSLVNSIEENMEDVIHSDTCSFEKEGIVEGTIEISCRLVIKCDDPPKAPAGVGSNFNKCIKPEDILFIMADSQRCPSSCDPCLDVLQTDVGDQKLELDFNRYNSFNKDAFQSDTIFTHDPFGDEIALEIKEMADECAEFVDKFLKSSGQKPTQKPPYRGSEEQKDHLVEPTSPKAFHSEQNQKDHLGIEGAEIKPTRFCPVCLNSMSWLPKFAACPKCGVKPMPITEEHHISEKPTTDNILFEYLGKKNEICEDRYEADSPQSTGCRCSCKFEKICSYCRVLKQCADFYKPLKKPEPIIAKESCESLDYCPKTNRSEPNRPFLSRVFSELRDMCDIKDTIKLPQMEKPRGSLTKTKNKNDFKEPQRAENKQSLNTEITRAAPENNYDRVLNKIDQRKDNVHHNKCGSKHGVVSGRHGWAWSSSKEAQKYGWRPGAVRRPIKRIMNFFLGRSPNKSAFNKCKNILGADKQTNEKPILNMCKKNGEIYITLRPVSSPHVEMAPIVIRIVKSDLAKAISQIKKRLKNQGFRKCTCHQTVMMCVCRNSVEKADLETALQAECQRYNMEGCADELVLSDTSDSEMEYDIDVTPPAGVKQTSCRVKSQYANNATQTAKTDLKVQTTYPVENSPYWRTYDCAAGDRYTGTAFGKPGEVVFEDGLFNYRGGGPHGASAKFGGREKNKAIWGSQSGGPSQVGGQLTTAKGFPGAIKKPRKPSAPIPVRMPKRFYEAKKAAAQSAKAAEMASKNKKPADMMKYMMQKGAVSKPWSPNANA